jgi:hypothetical protein
MLDGLPFALPSDLVQFIADMDAATSTIGRALNGAAMAASDKICRRRGHAWIRAFDPEQTLAGAETYKSLAVDGARTLAIPERHSIQFVTTGLASRCCRQIHWPKTLTQKNRQGHPWRFLSLSGGELF